MDRQDLLERSRALHPQVVALRRDIHRRPELAFEERGTSERIAGELARIGVECDTGVGKTGVLGRIVADPDLPTVALRADMDALPMTEASGEPFASEVDGVAHMCGHDAHAAMLVGAASVAALREAPHLLGPELRAWLD